MIERAIDMMGAVALVALMAFVWAFASALECPEDYGNAVEWETAHYREWCENNR